MPAWLRRAGHGRSGDGRLVTWSVAEGRRGRRWREIVRTGEGSAIVSSLLLEVDPDGRFSHLELSTAAGLLTLHPEGDGTLHGNTVTANGVQHLVALPWDPDRAIALEGSVVCGAAAAANAATASDQLRIGLDLSLERRDGPSAAVRLDADGLPMLLDGATWALETDD